jgi:hypothetical protein
MNMIVGPSVLNTLPGVPPGTCFLAYRGSIAHGMYCPPEEANAIDDIDLMGVVLAQKTHYLGLQDWGSRGTREIKEGRWDIVYYEIRKLVRLLLQGNPNVLGLLWTDPEFHLLCGDYGKQLISNRGLFVGKHVYNAFAGYAHAQLEKMETRDPLELREYLAVTAELKYRGAHPNHKGEVFAKPDCSSPPARGIDMWTTEKLIQRLRSYQKKGENIGYMGDKRKQLVLEHGYDSKNAAHLIRLLRMAKDFLVIGELEVYRSDAAELLEIKRGKWELVRVKEYAEQLFQEVKMARDASALPEGPDVVGAEKLLVGILEDWLK